MHEPNDGPDATRAKEDKTRNIGTAVEGASAPQSPAGRNIIVAIGIDAYQHQPPLTNAIGDAKAVLTLFKQCGFQELSSVPSLVSNDATRNAIAALPYQLSKELKPDDNLVLFYAGHGEKTETQVPDPAVPGRMQTRCTGYLIPVDGPKDAPYLWIHLETFLDDLSALPARHVFVILDACKSGIALADKFKDKGSGGQPAAISELLRRVSRRVMTSAQHDQKAVDAGSGTGHSLFAEALIAGIEYGKADKDGDGYVKSWDLFSCVQDDVTTRAKSLYQRDQMPDYGLLPGDGGGDLVISLREGAFNRLVEEGLRAMLCHDVPALETLVAKLVAVNPVYPLTLYLQFRLKFMQGDIQGALDLVTVLVGMDLPPGTLPLSSHELVELRTQLQYWAPVLCLRPSKLPVDTAILTSSSPGDPLHPAPLGPFVDGMAYQILDQATAQFRVTNHNAQPLFLNYVAIVPTGRLVIGPLIDPDQFGMRGLSPDATGVGRPFKVIGMPGSVTETRIFCSSQIIWDMLTPLSIAARNINILDPQVTVGMQTESIWHQIAGVLPAGPIDVRDVTAAFVT